MTTGKTVALTKQTFVSKVMSVLFNTLSGLVIAFLPRSKHLLISWLQSPSAVILEPKKMKIMAFSPITSWQIDGEIMETVTDFIFLGSKITAFGGCSHEIKRCLLLERKAMTNLGSVLKSRDITLLTKVCRVKVLRCESWTIKKADSQRIDAFELWCWRRFLTVPWTARRSNQSVLKKI